MMRKGGLRFSAARGGLPTRHRILRHFAAPADRRVGRNLGARAGYAGGSRRRRPPGAVATGGTAPRHPGPALDCAGLTGYIAAMNLVYSTYDAKARFSEVLRHVRDGRTVTVSYRGEPVAEIRAIRREPETLEARLDTLARRGVLVPAGPAKAQHPVAADRRTARRSPPPRPCLSLSCVSSRSCWD